MARENVASGEFGGICRKDQESIVGQEDEAERTMRSNSSCYGRGDEEKKIHEVEQFASYIRDLSDRLSSQNNSISNQPLKGRAVTHLVDFGSGQNYLGRTLASKPHNRHVIAVEGRSRNVLEAKRMDAIVSLAPKSGLQRNKKEFKQYVEDRAAKEGKSHRQVLHEALRDDKLARMKEKEEKKLAGKMERLTVRAKLDRPKREDGSGSVQYVEHELADGNLAAVIDEIAPVEQLNSSVEEAQDDLSQKQEENLLVMSIHSCGNLTHHGLRSLVLNKSVSAVAMVGCCYNLVSERLGPAPTKIPHLRPRDKTSRSLGNDPHGFPMSKVLCEYPTGEGKGIQMNITARMMAVQAPSNWTKEYSDSFFTRHFYRALLQKIFIDRGVAEIPTAGEPQFAGGVVSGGSQPIIIGSMRKAAYVSFVSYVRAAVKKLSQPANHHPSLASTNLPALIAERMTDITDEEILEYEQSYTPRKKHLSTIWTLMAYSAQLVEAVIVVDRWLWLREQADVGPGNCWVENVFDYEKSPRNLVVVGIKKDTSKSSLSKEGA